MRRIVVALSLSFALPASAQSNQPKDLRPLPEVPEPPELALPAPEPIRTMPRLSRKLPLPTVERIRSKNIVLNGRLYMIKVIPR